MKKFLAGLQKVENFIMITTFAIMVASSFAQVINRNIIQSSISWFDELAMYSMIWMTLLGAEMGLRDGTQVSIVAVVEKIDKMSHKAYQVVMIIAKLIVVAFTGIMFKSSIDMVLKQVQTGQTSAGLKLSMAVPYSALMVGFGIMTFVQLARIVSMVLEFGKKEGEEASECQE
ncbi:MAG: TRAP transporter small permease [Lachnospiraceae bacterium]|nr:TRAP transporter small permease [Lachnospiraceae bacterium]